MFPPPGTPESEAVKGVYALDATDSHESELKSALASWGAGAREVELIMAGLENTPALQAVVDFWQSGREVLVLSGGPGTGKTLAALQWLVLAANSYLYFGEKSQFCVPAWDPRALFLDIHSIARQGYWGPNAEKAFHRATGASLLVLDDLGAETASEGWVGQLDSVISDRNRNGKKLVITTNLTPDALAQRYGSRIASRLRQNCQLTGTGSNDLRQSPPNRQKQPALPF